VTALGLIGGGALVGKLVSKEEVTSSEERERLFASFGKYLELKGDNNSDLSPREWAVAHHWNFYFKFECAERTGKMDAFKEEVRKVILQSGQWGEEVKEEKDLPEEIVNGVLQLIKTEPQEFTGPLKKYLFDIAVEKVDLTKELSPDNFTTLEVWMLFMLHMNHKNLGYFLHHGDWSDGEKLNSNSMDLSLLVEKVGGLNEEKPRAALLSALCQLRDVTNAPRPADLDQLERDIGRSLDGWLPRGHEKSGLRAALFRAEWRIAEPRRVHLITELRQKWLIGQSLPAARV